MNSIGKAVYYLIARKRNLVIIIFVILHFFRSVLVLG